MKLDDALILDVFKASSPVIADQYLEHLVLNKLSTVPILPNVRDDLVNLNDGIPTESFTAQRSCGQVFEQSR